MPRGRRSDGGRSRRRSDDARVASPRRVSAERLTVGEILRRSAEDLAEAGSERPRLDAERLVGHAVGLDRVGLYMQLDRPLSPSELERAQGLVARRGTREPLQYVLGE